MSDGSAPSAGTAPSGPAGAELTEAELADLGSVVAGVNPAVLSAVRDTLVRYEDALAGLPR